MSAASEIERRSLPILATKLSIPLHRDDVISRPRLTDRLSHGLSGKLTLISAPPGFGKTTLVTEWLEQCDVRERVCWVGLDPGDNDPGRFLTYIVSAIRSVEPDFGPGLINLLQTAVSGDPALALVDLINALSSLPEQVVLVLEDYHVIRDDGVHRAVSYLIGHQPPGLHIIMTSRMAFPLPLSLLRTRRELAEFRTEDLRFTPEETSAFLQNVMRLNLPPERITALEQRTEGWIVGLLLAALGAEDAGQPEAALVTFGGEHRYVFDFLAEEVLRRQTPEVQDFLERTSVLNRISADLAASLGATACQETLDHLVAANLFTQPLDSEHSWYRYHQLFGEFLSARYRSRDPAGWEAAHARASDWFHEHGYRTDAAEHALAIGDQQRLIRLIETFGRDLLRRGRIPTLTRWLEALPEAVVSERPILALQMAWVKLLSRRFDEADKWIRRVNIDGVTDAALATGLRIDLAVCRATFARFGGDTDEIIRMSKAALDLFVASSKADDPYSSVALLHLGSAHRMRGDTLTSIEVLNKAAEIAEIGGGIIVQLNAKSLLTAAYGEVGEIDRAEALALETLAFERESGVRRLAMTEPARITLATILREREDFEAARAYLDDSLSSVQITGDAEDLTDKILALYELALVDAGLGNAAAALHSMDQVIVHARALASGPGTYGRALGMRAQVQLLLGQRESALMWAAGAEFSEDGPIGYLDEPIAIIRAWTDIELGRLEAAGQLLMRTIASLSEAGRQYRLAQARLLLAVVRQRQGREDEAAGLIDLAVAWMSQHGFRRTLLDSHPDLLGMLSAARLRALRAGRGWLGYLDDVMAASAGRVARASQPELAEPLSERELEVLALLQEGISNREIAERLFLSVGTVKRHTHNLYGKLEVANRTQAIIRGQDLGLLERG